MSDVPQGPGWWQASDGRWYPPQSAPTPVSPPPAPGSAMPGPAGAPSGTPAPKRSGGRGCVIALVVLAAIVGLGLVAVVLAVAFLGKKVEEALDVDPCPFFSDADAAAVFGSGSTAREVSGVFSVTNLILDTRVLPDAPSCAVVTPEGTGMARVAREQRGDASGVFAEERSRARGGTGSADESTPVGTTGYFLEDVELRDEAFCTTALATGQSGVLVRDGDTLVSVSVLIDPDTATTGIRPDETRSLDRRNCELAMAAAERVLD